MSEWASERDTTSAGASAGSPRLLADTDIAPFIGWCSSNRLVTLASCQGTGSGPAYILFDQLVDIDTFVRRVDQLASAHDTPEHHQLRQRIRGAGETPNQWDYEAAPLCDCGVIAQRCVRPHRRRSG